MSTKIDLKTSVVTAMLDALVTEFRAGSSQVVKMKVYNGPRPAPGGTATTLLLEVSADEDPPITVSGRTIEFKFPATALGLAGAGAGTTAVWARFEMEDGTWGGDTDVGTSGAGVIIDNTTIAEGQLVQILSTTSTYT